MFRDRTNLYISYRRTFPHHRTTATSRFDTLNDEEQGLVYHDDEDGEQIEMRPLPPDILKLSHEAQMFLSEIEMRITELSHLYKKNLLPGFGDTTQDEAKIDNLTFRITKDFQTIYTQIKQIDTIKVLATQNGTLKKSEIAMCDNIKKNLAIRVQELSQTFRKLQNNYIKYLKQDDYEIPQNNNGSNDVDYSNGDTNMLDELETTEKIESYSRQALQQSQQQLQQDRQQTISDEFIQQREREIYKIAQGVIEISTIFKELENMVIDQGTILDRIDYNLVSTVTDVKKAEKAMKKAESYQKQTTKCKIVLLLVLLIFLALMILIVKPKRVDHYHHDGDSGTTPDDSNSGTTSPNTDTGSSDSSDSVGDTASEKELISSDVVTGGENVDISSHEDSPSKYALL